MASGTASCTREPKHSHPSLFESAREALRHVPYFGSSNKLNAVQAMRPERQVPDAATIERMSKNRAELEEFKKLPEETRNNIRAFVGSLTRTEFPASVDSPRFDEGKHSMVMEVSNQIRDHKRNVARDCVVHVIYNVFNEKRNFNLELRYDLSLVACIYVIGDLLPSDKRSEYSSYADSLRRRWMQEPAVR